MSYNVHNFQFLLFIIFGLTCGVIKCMWKIFCKSIIQFTSQKHHLAMENFTSGKFLKTKAKKGKTQFILCFMLRKRVCAANALSFICTYWISCQLSCLRMFSNEKFSLKKEMSCFWYTMLAIM